MKKQQHFKTHINLFTTDNKGRSGLIMACLTGHNKMVEYLFKNVYSKYKHDEKSLENLLTNKKNNQKLYVQNLAMMKQLTNWIYFVLMCVKHSVMFVTMKMDVHHFI